MSEELKPENCFDLAPDVLEWLALTPEERKATGRNPMIYVHLQPHVGMDPEVGWFQYASTGIVMSEPSITWALQAQQQELNGNFVPKRLIYSPTIEGEDLVDLCLLWDAELQPHALVDATATKHYYWVVDTDRPDVAQLQIVTFDEKGVGQIDFMKDAEGNPAQVPFTTNMFDLMKSVQELCPGFVERQLNGEEMGIYMEAVMALM